VDHLPGDEFGHREPDDVHGAVEVGDDTPHLRAGQAVRLGTQAEDDLVAVDGVDVEVDGCARAAGRRDPVQQRPGGFAQLAGTAYPRRATSKGNSEASSRTLDVPAPCH
jgi:hypothetical protein